MHRIAEGSYMHELRCLEVLVAHIFSMRASGWPIPPAAPGAAEVFNRAESARVLALQAAQLLT